MAQGTIQISNGVGVNAVNIQDGGNSITVDGSVGFSGTYNATAPTITDGQTSGAQIDVRGNLNTNQGTLTAGEDLTNNVMRVEGQFSGTICAADTQIKASAGFLHTITISCNDAIPTAGTLIIYDNTAESGVQVFNHTFTTTPFIPFTITLDRVMTTGIYAGFTTTADVNVSITWR